MEHDSHILIPIFPFLCRLIPTLMSL